MYETNTLTHIHLLLTLTVVCIYRVFLEVPVVEALVGPRELQDLVGQMVHLVIKVQRVNWDHKETGGTRVCRE